MGLLLPAAALCAAPALTEIPALAANLRAGELPRQRRLCRVPLPWALFRALGNTIWSFWLMVLLLPFGRNAPPGLSACPKGPPPPDDRTKSAAAPPVVLVHGLYHNPSAWMLFARRLRAAGFADLRVFRYASFGRDFAGVAAELAAALPAAAGPDGRVLLVGHSLGGLLIRAACADPRLAAAGVRPAGLVTLGAPHQGSLLARLGPGRLAQSLAPGGAATALLRALPPCPAPWLSLFSPTDEMVLPLSGSLLPADAAAEGVREECLPPVSHVGLLFSREAARRTAGFLLRADLA